MANHGHVKTKKEMSPKAIAKLLEEANQKYFKNGFKIDFAEAEGDDWAGPSGTYAKYCWELAYPSKEHDGDWGHRICWLNSKKHFEMRHGGGGDFIWWADSLILALIADQFDGEVSDDGVEEIWPGEAEKIDTFKKYMERMWQNKSVLSKLVLQNLVFAPPEFRSQL